MGCCIIANGYRGTVTESIQRTDYRIDFEDRSDYLFAHIIGDHGTLSIAKQYWLDIIEAVMKREMRKILVVEDIPEVISIADVHQLVTDLSELPIRDIQLAFVDLYAQHSSLNQFGILVAENRGLAIRSFDSEAEAAAWLTTEPPRSFLSEHIELSHD
jgi:hypothetical protein